MERVEERRVFMCEVRNLYLMKIKVLVGLRRREFQNEKWVLIDWGFEEGEEQASNTWAKTQSWAFKECGRAKIQNSPYSL